MFRNASWKNTNLLPGILVTLLTAAVIIIVSFMVGRNDLFLLLNTDLGVFADYFFRFCTCLGDGLVWVPVGIFFILYRRRRLPLLVATILLSTLITQVTKNYIVPAEPRPTAAIKDLSLIHTVRNVELHTAYSFPSGHTATAFCIFLLLCSGIKSKWVIPFGFVYALLVGYSRVYLAQHFPLDVGAGMVTAVISVVLGMGIEERWGRGI